MCNLSQQQLKSQRKAKNTIRTPYQEVIDRAKNIGHSIPIKIIDCLLEK